MNDLNCQVVLQQSPVLVQEHLSSVGQEFLHLHKFTTGCSCKVRGCNTMKVCGSRTQPFLMVTIQVNHKQKRGMHILCPQGSLNPVIYVRVVTCVTD